MNDTSVNTTSSATLVWMLVVRSFGLAASVAVALLVVAALLRAS